MILPPARILFPLMPVLLCMLLATGCDWYRHDETTLRALPYPHDAGVAVDDGSEPTCLSSRGVTFVYDGDEVRTAGQDAARFTSSGATDFWPTASSVAIWNGTSRARTMA